MKKTAALIGNLIFVAVVLYLCYFIIEAVQNKSPSVFGYRMLRVMSESMAPVFDQGDCIIIKEIPKEELKVGDIITFVSPDPMLEGRLNTHRIVDIAEDYTGGGTVYFTKGDNNNWEDDYTIGYDAIVGRYQMTLPLGKTISAFLEKLSEQDYFFSVVMVPILICFVSCILQLVKDIRKR